MTDRIKDAEQQTILTLEKKVSETKIIVLAMEARLQARGATIRRLSLVAAVLSMMVLGNFMISAHDLVTALADSQAVRDQLGTLARQMTRAIKCDASFSLEYDSQATHELGATDHNSLPVTIASDQAAKLTVDSTGRLLVRTDGPPLSEALASCVDQLREDNKTMRSCLAHLKQDLADQERRR